jgi:hypothetical protein
MPSVPSGIPTQNTSPISNRPLNQPVPSQIPAQAPPEQAATQAPVDQNQVNTALGAQPSAGQASLVSDEPSQVGFPAPLVEREGLGAQLGMSLGMLGAIFAGAPSKSFDPVSKQISATGFQEKSVDATLAESKHAQRIEEARAKQAASKPPAASEDPNAQAPVEVPINPLQTPRPEQRPEQSEEPEQQ